MQGKTSTVFVS